MLTSCSSREAAQEKPLPQTEQTELSEESREEKEAEEENKDLQAKTETDLNQKENESQFDLPSQEEENESQSDLPNQEDGDKEEQEGKAESQEADLKGKEGKYSQYNWLIDPLEPFELLTEDFSAQNPPDFGNARWYDLVVHSEKGTEFTDEEVISFPADTVENIITEHFEVSAEQIRTENEAYSTQENSYRKPESSSENSEKYFGISGAKEQDGVFALVVDLYNEDDKIFNTSILTIQMVEEEGKETSWKYLSNQVLFRLSKE